MTDERRHEMECPCGCRYSLTEDAIQLGMLLAEYARVRPDRDGVTRLDAAALQWLQDVGRADGVAYHAIVSGVDRTVVARFISGDTRSRRGRQAWRAVAAELGTTAPFDIKSPEQVTP